MSNGRDVKYFFRSSKDYQYSSDHKRFFACLKILKKGKYLSADLEMNWLSAAILPVSCCISFLELRCFVSMIAFIFLKLASIPHCDTRNLNFSLKITPNAHLVGFNFNWYRRSVSKASSKSQIWSEVWRFFTSILQHRLPCYIWFEPWIACWLTIDK